MKKLCLVLITFCLLFITGCSNNDFVGTWEMKDEYNTYQYVIKKDVIEEKIEGDQIVHRDLGKYTVEDNKLIFRNPDFDKIDGAGEFLTLTLKNGVIEITYDDNTTKTYVKK